MNKILGKWSKHLKNASVSWKGDLMEQFTVDYYMFARLLQGRAEKTDISKFYKPQNFDLQISIPSLPFPVHHIFIRILFIFRRSYLILGKEKDGDRSGLTITQRSLIIEWRDEWHARIKRLQRRSHECK